MFKKINCIVLCFALIFFVTSCGSKNGQISEKFLNIGNAVMPEQNTKLENGKFILEIDENSLGVILIDKTTGKVWQSTPDSGKEEFDELGMPIKKHPLLNSVLAISYLDTKTNSEVDAISYTDCVKEKKYKCVKENNSIIVEFFFSTAQFSIPVVYSLTNNCFEVKIDTKKIKEGENRLLKISLFPFMCSALNDSSDTYLFIPSGSGAIITPKTYSKTGLQYSSQVYGEDLSMEKKTMNDIPTSVRLPVFGSKSQNDKAMFAIIENGDECSFIDSTVGSSAYNFSCVYPTFLLRGYTQHTAKVFSKSVENYSYSKEMIDEEFSVKYYPLNDEKANYSGMADTYKKYLVNEQGMVKNGTQKALSLNLIGGTMVTESFLGVPYKKIFDTTTMEDAVNIVKDVNKSLKSNFDVILNGYGESGIDVSKIAGGYSIRANKNVLNELKKECSSDNADLYMNFDLVRFNEMSDGFSVFKNASYAANGKKASQYLYNNAVKNYETDTVYYLLSPYSITKACDKLLEKTKSLNIDGYLLESLSSSVYSDYKSKKSTMYYARSGYKSTVVNSLKSIENSDKKISGYDANAFFAIKCNLIVNTPLSSDNEYGYTYNIPFYQMVFRGYIPIYSESMNTSSNTDKMFLKAAECGIGLNYTIISEWNNKLIDSYNTVFFNSVYKDVKDVMVSNCKKMSELLDSIGSSEIVMHEIINSDVRKVLYGNGTTVYVNYGNDEFVTDKGVVQPNDFMIAE